MTDFRMTNEELVEAVKGASINMAQLAVMSVEKHGADAIAEFCIDMSKRLYTMGYAAGLAETYAMGLDTVRALDLAMKEDGKVRSEHVAATGPLYPDMVGIVGEALGAQQKMFLKMIGVDGVDHAVEVVNNNEPETNMPGGEA